MNSEPNSHTPPNVSRGSYTDKKFNVILYGINECQPGMSKLSRLESDLASVVSVLSTIDSSIHIQSIKDCFRLGKFSPGKSRPRPILVRFIRIAEVTSILSRKGKLSRPYSIKPDMSYEQRLRESVIMKERWSLIQSGIDRKDIKIRMIDFLFTINCMVKSKIKNFILIVQRQFCLPQIPLIHLGILLMVHLLWRETFNLVIMFTILFSQSHHLSTQ